MSDVVPFSSVNQVHTQDGEDAAASIIKMKDTTLRTEVQKQNMFLLTTVVANTLDLPIKIKHEQTLKV